MAHFDYDIGVIGGGAAGLTITSGAAQLGAKALLIEKENALGGDCLHFGCVPSKTLIQSAHIYRLMTKTADFGLPTMKMPAVDFHLIKNRIQSVISTIQKHDSEERFCSLGARVEFGQPTFQDEHAIRLDAQTYTAKNWVIATGSSPAIPPIPGLSDTSFITNKEIFSLDHLPKSMAILGAGPIGIEMAQAFCRLGTQVSVIDRADQILVKEDKSMADDLMYVLQSEGVTFHLGASIEAVGNSEAKKVVSLKTKEGKTLSLNADQVLVAMGRRANVSNLALEKIGIDFNPRGIMVDGRLRTSQKHIYAAGDVNGHFQFTHAAGYEGGIVVSNAIFHLPRKADYSLLPWCTYTDPELASIGMNEKSARAAGIDYSVWTETFDRNDRSLAEGNDTGKIKMILDKGEKPIGIQILGPKAGELLCEWISIFNGKIRLSTLASAVHPYPTLSEINKKIAGNLYAQKIFSGKVKKGLKIFFQLKGRACDPLNGNTSRETETVNEY